MRPTALITMCLELNARARKRLLCFGLMLAMGPGFAADIPGPAGAAAANRTAADKDTIVSTTPMQIAAEDTGAHGQLVVAPEILSADTRTDLIFTITAEPLHGRVGLAGDHDRPLERAVQI